MWKKIMLNKISFLQGCLLILKVWKYSIRKNGRHCNTSKMKKRGNMSNSNQLSKKLMTIGGGKTLTKTANKMDKLIVGCVKQIQIKLQEEYNGKINLYHDTKIYLKDIVAKLRKIYPNEIWFYNFEKSTIKPDGGILYIVDNDGRQYPILIAEQKSQGTNDRIVQETGKKQSKGNAIERLGKNLIGLRTWMKKWGNFSICLFWFRMWFRTKIIHFGSCDYDGGIFKIEQY